MNTNMHRRLFIGGMLILFFVATPLSAEAGLVNCATSDHPEPCTICHLVQGGVSVINWGMTVMTAIAITVIVAMSILYIISSGDEGMMGTAKGGIKAAFIGFAVILSAWLIVNTTLRIFGATAITGYTPNGNSFSFTCSTASNAGSAQPEADASLPAGSIGNSTPISNDGARAGSADTATDLPSSPAPTSDEYHVTLSAGTGGVFLQGTGKNIRRGQSAQFILAADVYYQVGSVSGCGGSLSGDTYTVPAVTGDCTITATFVAKPPTTPNK